MPKITVNDVSLYYELLGPEDAPVLVLNNGLIMNAETSWVFQKHVLSEHYRLLLYDCRGQGQSGHPDELYSMEQHADDLTALLRELGIENAHIGGISYGGEVAQAFALKYPAKTRSLILIDTVSEVHVELQTIVESWIDALESRDPIRFYNATVSWNFSPAFIRANPELFEDARKRYAALDFPAVTRLCRSFLEVNYTGRLKEIQVPTCIMVGELDLIKGPAYARILKKGIPHAEYHQLAGSGHATCWERPEEFNSVILGFLAKQP